MRIARRSGMWPHRSFEGASDEERARLFREAMVEHQLGARGISDPRVLAAMAEVPRHLFARGWGVETAYVDGPLPIGFGQTISQPLIVAMMLEALELRGDERVLDVGTGSGYQAALLGQLAREVYSVEIVPELARSARALLARLGAENVHIVATDGSLGYRTAAPYQAIVVAAAAPDVPQPLVEQLDEGGRLVIPVGDDFGQSLLRVRRHRNRTETEFLTRCAFVPLVGEHGRT